jgi:hypothetical protein
VGCESAAALAIVETVLVKDFTSGGARAADGVAATADAALRRRTSGPGVTLGAVYRIAPSNGSRRTIDHPARLMNHVSVQSR